MRATATTHLFRSFYLAQKSKILEYNQCTNSRLNITTAKIDLSYRQNKTRISVFKQITT